MGTAANVLIGVGKLYVAPALTAIPTLPTTKAGTVTWTSWTDVGYTEGGVTFDYAPEVFEGKVDQELAPVITELMGESLKIKTNLAEATVKNLARAISASTFTSTAATTSTAAKNQVEFGSGTLAETMIGFEGTAPGGGRRVIVIYRARSTGTAGLAYKKDALNAISVEWGALADATKDAGKRLCKIIDLIADHS